MSIDILTVTTRLDDPVMLKVMVPGMCRAIQLFQRRSFAPVRWIIVA